MAVNNVFDTHRSVGIREDLTDVIYNISPTDTPFISNIGSGTAKGVKHEWQTDALDPPGDASRAHEGQDVAALLSLAPTVRLNNICQINSKSFGITGTDMVADNAGRGVEMAYQEAKKGLELRRDMEFRCVAVNEAKVEEAGTTTSRETAGVLSWIATNDSFGAGGVSPAGTGADARTPGTNRTFTETHLETVIDNIYAAGGDPDVLMTNTTQRRVITNTFLGVASSRVDQALAEKRIINAVDFYESDYGTLSIVPNRIMRQSEVFVLDTSMWEIAYHRPFFSHDLAKIGDSERKQMLVEWCLVSKNEKASGGVFDLS